MNETEQRNNLYNINACHFNKSIVGYKDISVQSSARTVRRDDDWWSVDEGDDAEADLDDRDDDDDVDNTDVRDSTDGRSDRRRIRRRR